MKLKRLHLAHLRLILTLAVDFLSLAEAVASFGWLRPWLLPNRRGPTRYHLIRDARQAWWPFNPPRRERTPQVLALSLAGMTVVLITALVNAASGRLEMILSIPLYAAYVVIVLQIRQRKLDVLEA